MGLYVRCGIEDTLFGPDGKRATSVQQIERIVRIARNLRREIAIGQDARRIYRIGECWRSAEQTLAQLGMTPNRAPGQRGVPLRRAA